MIFKQDIFIDDQGASIQSRTPVLWVDDPHLGDRKMEIAGPTIYQSVGYLEVGIPTPVGVQRQQIPFNFEVAGKDVQEAFANLPAAFALARDRAVADFQKQHAAQQQALVGLDGKPLAKPKLHS